MYSTLAWEARSLIAGLFLAAVAYVVMTKRPKVRRFGFIGILVFVLLAGAIYTNHSKFTPGSTLYRLANLKDSNTEARLVQWKMALEGYKDYPVLGVGAENYYIIFNSHFNPEMYKYDASWFDKPHNFLIEVLVTNGPPGLLVYLGMIFFALYGLWRAFKADLISLSEMCLLFAGLIAYQIQNLFVFDTVSASVAFYAFLGFSSYVWTESKNNITNDRNLNRGISSVKATVSFAGAFIIICYLVYITNITSLEAAKRVNFGYVYTSYEPQIAANYFESALLVPMNLDPRETAGRYSDFVATLVASEGAVQNSGFVSEQLEKSLKAQRAVTETTKNDPLLWLRLAIGEMNNALWHQTSMDPAWQAINKAIEIAPRRIEIKQTVMQLYSINKDWPNVLKTAQEIIHLNPYSSSLRWQLAMAYYLNGQTDEAAKAGDEAVLAGFEFSQLQQFAWYVQYYLDKGENEKVVPLLEKAINLEPDEIGLYTELAKTYASLGNLDRAESLAKQVMVLEPSQTQEMREFIESLR